MKHLRLFLVAIAAVFGLNANAQSWTAEEVAAGDFVLYNVGTGQYFTKGNGWGTQASITTGSEGEALRAALKLQIEALPDGNYKLRTDVNGSGYGVENMNGGTIYTDQSRGQNCAWSFVPVEGANGPVYNIISAGDEHEGGPGVYLTALEGGTIVGPGQVGSVARAQWKLLSYANASQLIFVSRYTDVKTACLSINPNLDTTESDAIANSATTTQDVDNAVAKVRQILLAYIPTATIPEGSFIDLTNAIINNPTVSANTDYWNSDNVVRAVSWGTGPTTNYGETEFYQSTFDFNQSVYGLPNGTYEFGVTGFHRAGNHSTYFYAGDDKILIPGVGSDVVNDMAGAQRYFDAGNGKVALKFVLEQESNDIKIGILNQDTQTDRWTIFRNFTLHYYGTQIDLSEYQARLAEAVAAAEALEGSIPAGAYQALAAVVAENNKEFSSKEDYNAAIEAVEAATENAKALQAPYSRYQTIKNAVLAINADIDTTAPDATANAATSVADIEEAVQAVRNALSEYLANANIEDAQIDLTAALIDNPAPGNSGNLDYWTNTDGASLQNNLWEYWQVAGGTTTQNIATALPAGYYTLTAIAYTRDNMTATLHAGENTMNIVGVNSNTVNTRSEGDAWIAQGNGINKLQFKLNESTTNLEIGLTADNTTADYWMCWRSFELKYLGTNPVSLFVSDYEEALAAANTANNDEANANVTGSEKTAIENAIADKPEQTIESYIEKTEALKAATQAFVAAAPDYNAYAAEKAIAEMIGVTPGEEPANAAAAAAGVNALKVAEFDFVKENYKYDYEPVIGTFGEWTATATVDGQPAEPNYLDYEHWSGQTHAYYEQAANGWGNEHGWTVQYEKTAKLPAGDYMLKVAARSSAGTWSLVSCSATENTVSLPSVGNTAKGIDINGNAAFEGDNFAHNGLGFGWEWRYLPFTLTETADVTMTFYAEANTQYQWMSIADATLLSKQEIQNIVEIAGTDEWAPEAQIATSVITDRKLLEGLNTVIFPFVTTDAELGATTVLAYTGTTVEADGLTFNFQKVAPVDGVVTLQANTPYAVFVAADQTENLTFGTKNINPGGGWYNECVTTDPNGKFDFRGTYSEWKKGESAIGDKDYIAGKERFVKASGGNRLQAYRAYLQFVGTEEPANVAFNFGGFVVDGIEAVELLNNLSGNIYNLNGQKLQKAQKGINIVNGKKVLVK